MGLESKGETKVKDEEKEKKEKDEDVSAISSCVAGFQASS